MPLCSALFKEKSYVWVLGEHLTLLHSHRHVQEADLYNTQMEEPSFAHLLQRRNYVDRSYNHIQKRPLVFPPGIWFTFHDSEPYNMRSIFSLSRITSGLDAMNGLLFCKPEVNTSFRTLTILNAVFFNTPLRVLLWSWKDCVFFKFYFSVSKCSSQTLMLGFGMNHLLWETPSDFYPGASY